MDEEAGSPCQFQGEMLVAAQVGGAASLTGED